MATFSIVSQALRTGEPIPQAFNTNLFERLHYHGDVGHYSYVAKDDVTHDDVHRRHLDSIKKYEFLFYATAISSVFQLLDVSIDILLRVETLLISRFAGPQRVAEYYYWALRRDTLAGVFAVEGPV